MKAAFALKVIPVIDILNGIAVHAVKGKRKDYQPLQSTLTSSVDPVDVAKTFSHIGFSALYVADLDAIMGGKANFEVLRRIVHETGLELMVDSGITDNETIEKLLKINVSKIIIGTETLNTKNFVKDAVRLYRADRIIVSLDLVGEEVKVKSDFDGPKNFEILLSEFMSFGVFQFIVLDLSRVGSGEGVNLSLLKKIKNKEANLFTGGGIRSLEDLNELKQLSVSGVLIATALHSGKIRVEDLKLAEML